MAFLGAQFESEKIARRLTMVLGLFALNWPAALVVIDRGAMGGYFAAAFTGVLTLGLIYFGTREAKAKNITLQRASMFAGIVSFGTLVVYVQIGDTFRALEYRYSPDLPNEQPLRAFTGISIETKLSAIPGKAVARVVCVTPISSPAHGPGDPIRVWLAEIRDVRWSANFDRAQQCEKVAAAARLSARSPAASRHAIAIREAIDNATDTYGITSVKDPTVVWSFSVPGGSPRAWIALLTSL